MKCKLCGSGLRPFNFLEDKPEKHRHLSKARLVGFSNPDGWKCTNAKKCTAAYVRGEDGALYYVEATKVRHDHREDLGEAGDIWEIVDEWELNESSRMEWKEMDETRKGQIAILYLKNKLREDGVRLTPNFRRQVGNTAKAIGISVDEAMEFSELLVRELVEEAFAKSDKHS